MLLKAQEVAWGVSTDPAEPVIEINALGKSFGKVHALKGVDLEIRRGEFFGFFGPNGAGKTTLLRILTGQIEPGKGEASVLGIDLPDGAVEVRSRVGVVPEFESPPSFLTGDEYLRFVTTGSTSSNSVSIATPSARTCPRGCVRRSCWVLPSSTNPTCCSSTSRSSTSTPCSR
jgi:ABC-type molybdenum transport system ATPase subunit/photorepair protein PhrA